MRFLRSALGALMMLGVCAATPAQAAIVRVLHTGTVVEGVDPTGVFGLDPSLTFSGQTFQSEFIFDTSAGSYNPEYNYRYGDNALNYSGPDGVFRPSPALSASITINDVTYAFIMSGFGGLIHRQDQPQMYYEVANSEITNGVIDVSQMFFVWNAYGQSVPFSFDGPFTRYRKTGDEWFGEAIILLYDYSTSSYLANARLVLQPQFMSIGAPVPEPSTWAMMLIGFAGLALAATRRERRAA